MSRRWRLRKRRKPAGGIPGRVDLDRADAEGSQRSSALGLDPGPPLCSGAPEAWIGRLGQDLTAALPVVRGEEADIPKGTLAAVGQAARDDLVPAVRPAQSVGRAAGLEVGERERDRAAADPAQEMVERGEAAGAAGCTRCLGQAADHAQDGVPIAPRRQPASDQPGEELEPKAIAFAHGTRP